MKTYAENNRVETDRSKAPKGRGLKKSLSKTAKWLVGIIATATVATAVWVTWGVARTVMGAGEIKAYQFIIALLILRWFLSKGNRTLKTIILIAIILIINK